MIIDTHAHINHEKLAEDLGDIIKNCELGKVGKIICPSFSVESSETSLIVSKNKNIFCALGIHPEMAQEYNDNFENFLRANLNNPKVVAIGEIGLDYHFGTDSKELQKQVLIKQMELAHEFDLPIIFHVRDAFDDFFEIFAKHKELCKLGVIHCFEGDSNIAKQALDLGLYISLTGLITFKPREKLREAVKVIPLDKIMIETDSPYLAPEPYRGKVNRPEYVIEVAKKLADIKGETLEIIENITTKNAYKFFEKMRLFDETN